MTAQTSDGHGVEGSVEVAVSPSVESMTVPLSAAGLYWCCPGQRSKGGLVAYPSSVRPADEQLGGHDRSDARLGKEISSGGVGFDKLEQLRIAFADLGR